MIIAAASTLRNDIIPSQSIRNRRAVFWQSNRSFSSSRICHSNCNSWIVFHVSLVPEATQPPSNTNASARSLMFLRSERQLNPDEPGRRFLLKRSYTTGSFQHRVCRREKRCHASWWVPPTPKFLQIYWLDSLAQLSESWFKSPKIRWWGEAWIDAEVHTHSLTDTTVKMILMVKIISQMLELRYWSRIVSGASLSAVVFLSVAGCERYTQWVRRIFRLL